MRSFLFASLLVSSVPLAACGDDDGTGGGTTSTSTSTSAGSTSSSTSATATSSTGSGTPSDITPTINAVSLTGSCMPGVPEDPIIGGVDVTYDNAGETPGVLTVTSATLELTGIDAMLVFTFDLDPSSSGMVGAFGSVGVPHAKVAGSGMGNGEPPCGYCDAPGTVTINWTDDVGGTAEASFPIAAFPCAF